MDWCCFRVSGLLFFTKSFVIQGVRFIVTSELLLNVILTIFFTSILEMFDFIFLLFLLFYHFLSELAVKRIDLNVQIEFINFCSFRFTCLCFELTILLHSILLQTSLFLFILSFLPFKHQILYLYMYKLCLEVSWVVHLIN